MVVGVQLILDDPVVQFRGQLAPGDGVAGVSAGIGIEDRQFDIPEDHRDVGLVRHVQGIEGTADDDRRAGADHLAVKLYGRSPARPVGGAINPAPEGVDRRREVGRDRIIRELQASSLEGQAIKGDREVGLGPVLAELGPLGGTGVKRRPPGPSQTFLLLTPGLTLEGAQVRTLESLSLSHRLGVLRQERADIEGGVRKHLEPGVESREAPGGDP